MEIRVRQKGKVVIFDLEGRIDVDSANLVEAVGQCVREGCSAVQKKLLEFIERNLSLTPTDG